MTTATTTRIGDDQGALVGRSPQYASRTDWCKVLDRSVVAKLGNTTIDKMTCDELVLVIHASELLRHPWFRCHQHLAFQNRETLKRLAYLARQCCQNQQT